MAKRYRVPTKRNKYYKGSMFARSGHSKFMSAIKRAAVAAAKRIASMRLLSSRKKNFRKYGTYKYRTYKKK